MRELEMIPLQRLSWSDAKRRKWDAGRQKYGAAWCGDHPLIEAYSEIVDLDNYLDEAARRGCCVEPLRMRVHSLAAGLRVAISEAQLDEREVG